MLLVEDEGVGIPPEDVDTIFQPFRGSFGKGTGLGLAIVHRIVTDYGGLHRGPAATGGRHSVPRQLPRARGRACGAAGIMKKHDNREPGGSCSGQKSPAS